MRVLRAALQLLPPDHGRIALNRKRHARSVRSVRTSCTKAEIRLLILPSPAGRSRSLRLLRPSMQPQIHQLLAPSGRRVIQPPELPDHLPRLRSPCDLSSLSWRPLRVSPGLSIWGPTWSPSQLWLGRLGHITSLCRLAFFFHSLDCPSCSRDCQLPLHLFASSISQISNDHCNLSTSPRRKRTSGHASQTMTSWSLAPSGTSM